MKKNTVLIIVAVIILIIAVSGASIIIENNREKKEEELKMTYYALNMAFGSIVNGTGSENYRYLPVNLADPHVNDIACFEYIYIALFRRETGGSLTYDQVTDYLSKEYEDDGELRIYTNGRHPEIAAYIEWYGQNWDKMRSHMNKLSSIYHDFGYVNRDFPTCLFYLVPVEILDELIKKEADPDYEMDLIGIQNRYIAEGRAKVSENGVDIEYFPKD